MKTKYWTLKILSGTHSGAEIPLSDGLFSIGTGDHCDLVLQDPALSSQLGTMRITKEQVFFQPEGAEESELQANHKVAVGGLTLGIMPVGESWIEVSEPGPSIDEPLVEAMGDGSDSILTTHKRQRVRVAALILGLLFIGGIASFLIKRYDVNLPSFTSEEPAPQTIEMILPSSVKVVQKDHGVALLKGHLATEADKDELLRKLDKLGQPFKLEVEIQTLLLKAARVSLDLQKMHSVQVEASEDPSSLILTGFSENPAKWAAVLKNLKKDIRGVDVWVDQVQSSQDRVTALKEMLASKNIETVKVKEKLGRIDVMGSVPGNKAKDWQGVVKEYREKFSNQPPLKSVNAMSKKLEVVSINAGEMPYIVTDDGEIFMIGAEIEAGVVIQAIHQDRMILEKKGSLFTHYF